MELTTSEKNGVTILSLKGKILGGPEAGAINDKIHENIESGKKKIVLDMEGLELMNSSGLGILIAAVTTLKNNDGALVLCHVPERTRHLLKMTRLLNVFDLYDSVDEAIAKLNA